MPSPFPIAAPTVAGTNITVSMFLNNPARVQRAIENLALQRFVADLIFADGPAATGGAVIYDQVTANDLYLSQDVQEIEPGSEFPVLSSPQAGPLVAIARKYGGEVLFTDEAVRRDRRDLLQRDLVRLRNTIVRKYDTLSMAALDAAPIITMAGSGDWTTGATDIIGALATPANPVDVLDLGYETDTVLINPAQELDLLKDADIRSALPRERTDVPIATGNLGRLVGHDFVVTNRVTAGTAYVLQRKVAGSISDEVPLYARTIDDRRREATFIHGARVGVPYVTDPKAVVKLTGI